MLFEFKRSEEIVIIDAFGIQILCRWRLWFQADTSFDYFFKGRQTVYLIFSRCLYLQDLRYNIN